MKIEKVNPIPQGKYVVATRFENLIFTAGMTPRKNGILLLTGKIKSNIPLEEYREAVYQATSNALIAAQSKLCEGEDILQILSLSVFVNAENDYSLHSKIADYASEYLCNELGESGIAARVAIGLGSLPGDAPVEIQLICAVIK